MDDLPGISAETERRRGELADRFGEARVTRVAEGGRRILEAEPDLDAGEKKEFNVFLAQLDRRRFLEERGIVVTSAVLREAVRRDIEALFNVERLQVRHLFGDHERGEAEDPEDVLTDFPRVRRSVLNYGVPSFSGRRARDFDADTLSRELKEILAVFEPRLRPDSVKVKVTSSDKVGLRIAIEGILMLSPVPERLRLSTSIDLDNGRAATEIEEA
jgi:type VI secretion system protein ImpF